MVNGISANEKLIGKNIKWGGQIGSIKRIF